MPNMTQPEPATAIGQAANPAATPTNAQRAWQELGYGMFIHFGPNTFAGKAWGDGKLPAAAFSPSHLDPRQWADVAAEAGMKYAVLTTKHHDGFCLWPSRHTEYSIKNSPGRPDVVRAFVDAFREAGLKVGLYYSLWDVHFAEYENDAVYAAYMQAQIRELLTDYGPILELWFDGGWDKEFPTREWPWNDSYREGVPADVLRGGRWHWRELYDLAHALQPECLVINNSSSDRPGIPRYLPIDVRTSEHYDFVWNDRIHQAHTEPVFKDDAGQSVYLPLEFTTSLNPDWFYIPNKHVLHPSVAAICDWYTRARQGKANLLLNVGPDTRGLIPEYHRTFLKEARRRLAL